MPFAGEFRAAMGFPNVGDMLDGFTVEHVGVGHAGSGPGRYDYPTEIIVTGKGGKEGVRRALRPLSGTRRTIFSEYGNPYQCTLGTISRAAGRDAAVSWPGGRATVCGSRRSSSGSSTIWNAPAPCPGSRDTDRPPSS